MEDGFPLHPPILILFCVRLSYICIKTSTSFLFFTFERPILHRVYITVASVKMAAYIDWASNKIINILNWSIIARFSKKHDWSKTNQIVWKYIELQYYHDWIDTLLKFCRILLYKKWMGIVAMYSSTSLSLVGVYGKWRRC